MGRLMRDGTLPKPSREAKFSGANGDREMLIFPVQLTTSRIGNLTQLIHTLLCVMTIHTHMYPMILPFFETKPQDYSLKTVRLFVNY